MKAKRVVLIGWDAADWKVIDQLIEKGQMPALEGMMKKGVRGNLSTLEPVLSPMLWTSIATGKYADKHGIHGFTEPDHEAGIVRPISSISRKSRAFWNILTNQGKKTNVFSWWPSNPAEPIDGIMVSNLYQRANKSMKKGWPMNAGTVHPSELADHFKSIRIHPDELTEEHILPFLPMANKIDQEKDKRLGSLSKIIADAATVHSASTWALENTDWDLTAIYHDAIDHACHAFMKFRAPQLPNVPEDLFEIYKDAVDGMYRFHDMMLERTLKLVGPDTNVILISDHGFQSDHMRPLSLPKEPAGPAAEHRKHGVICCFGPDFNEGQTIYGSSILDITPTLLTLFGLPIGEDMDGTPLLQAFKSPPTVKTISSWENVDGHFGEHSKTFEVSKEEAQKAVKQLIELGYVEDLGDDMAKAMENTDIELKYNLSKVFLSTGRSPQALELLLEVNGLKPEYRFQIRIVECFKRMKRFEEAIEMLNVVEQEDDENKKVKSLKLARADIFKSQEKYNEALKILIELQNEIGNIPSILKSLGDCYLSLNKWKEAVKTFQQCLVLDAHDASSHKALAMAFLNLKDYEKSIESSLTATELFYQYPAAHFLLGQALVGLGEYEMAARSFEVTLTMRPSFSAARIALDEIYKNHTVDKENLFKDVQVERGDAKNIKSKASQSIDKLSGAKSYKGRKLGSMVVVSGLPRSGTSLMMQMLNSGGVDIYQDNLRTPDENNPNGFFEHENVKALMKGNNWLKDAKGKAIKVVSPLVRFLSPSFTYKVIVMKRDIVEIVNSQHKMLVRAGKAKSDSYPVQMEETLKKQYNSALDWMHKQPNFEVIEIDFTEAINSPDKISETIVNFLGMDLNRESMASSPDKSLYRNRNKK